MSENQAEFKGWARVEVMGHQTHIGYVTTEAYGQAVLFRVDRPEIPEADEILEETEWVGDQLCPAGSVVKRSKVEAVSVLVGSGSIYRIIPCTEEAALKAIRQGERRPLMVVSVPVRSLEAATSAEPHADPYDLDPFDDDEDDDDEL